jgi:O-antigen biosynthesis protein
MMADFPALPGGRSAGRGPLEICIATPDIVGPIRNGGIGSALTALAELLAGDGHKVTILYTWGDYCEAGSIQDHIRSYKERSIDFIPCREASMPLVGPDAAAVPYKVYEMLRHMHFDVIHFPEWRGHGYYCLTAKKLGVAFRDTHLVVQTHSPTLWHRIHNLELIDDPELLLTDHLERQSVELADIVVSPSQYLLKWMLDKGWKLPARTYVHPNAFPAQPQKEESHAGHLLRIAEIVFFGRLEMRKGLDVFCDAVDLLLRKGLKHFSVTFLGKFVRSGDWDSQTYIARRANAWPVSWQTLTHLDTYHALDYLKQEGRLAVIASRADNSPFTVTECLYSEIPFLAAEVGGIPEMIHADDAGPAIFPLNATALAGRLKQCLLDGAHTFIPRLELESIAQGWTGWHRSLVTETQESAADFPLVTVCMATFNRPAWLREAIDSLQKQTYPNFEVILVDDGSSLDEAQATLDELDVIFRARGWRIIRRQNENAAAARNHAAGLAQGKWLLFMDDDNISKPHEIETLARAIQASNAAIITCLADLFASQPDEPGSRRALFTGNSIAFGVLENCFGDTNCLIARDVFEALGGFTEDYGVAHEDWELLAKAALAGYAIYCLPEALFWYRYHAESFGRNLTQQTANRLRNIRPYLAAFPGELAGVPLLAQGLYHQNRDLHKRNRELASAVERLEQQVAQSEDHVKRLKHEISTREQYMDSLKEEIRQRGAAVRR